MKNLLVILFLSILQLPIVYGQEQESGISDLFYVYTTFISDTRGQSCPMYPSCSHYSMQAFGQHGALKGLLMTSDRLIRCGHEHRIYDLNWEKGEAKFEDFPNWEFDENPIPQRFPVKFSKNVSFYDQSNDTTFFLSLINSKDYQSALVEYKRLAHFGEKNHQALILELNHLIALNGLGEYEKVIFHYDTKLVEHLKSEPGCMVQIKQF